MDNTTHACLARTNCSGADLDSVNLRGAILWQTEWKDARLPKSLFKATNFIEQMRRQEQENERLF
jgi:uncharacterized protein YjbI with pentapeptide repeats